MATATVPPPRGAPLKTLQTCDRTPLALVDEGDVADLLIMVTITTSYDEGLRRSQLGAV
jgi:hypothetical protein